MKALRERDCIFNARALKVHSSAARRSTLQRRADSSGAKRRRRSRLLHAASSLVFPGLRESEWQSYAIPGCPQHDQRFSRTA